MSRVGGAILFEGRDRLAQKENGCVPLRRHRIALVFLTSMTALDPAMRVGDLIPV